MGEVPQWRAFARAMVEEVDASGAPGERDAMLRRVGVRMARLLPLPAAGTLDALGVEVNDALARIDWGAAALTLDEAERAVRVVHTGLPGVGAADDGWLGALLEGLYGAWFAAQPGSQAGLSARRVAGGAGAVALRYARC